jgi:hypothetical protein
MPDGGGEIKVDVLGSTPARESGPRAWLVLLGTAIAAVAVIGGVFAFQAWQDDEDASPPTVVPVPETEPPDEELAQGNFLFRRVTADGIEVRARLNEFPMGGGIFMEAPAATAVAGTTADTTAPADGPEGLARPQSAPPDTETATASPTTVAVAPRPVDPGIGGAIVDPDDLPPECEVVGDVMAWAISDENVAQGSGPWTKVVPTELYPSLMWDGFGGMQNDPDASSIVGVVLQVPADVTVVRMRTAGGATDEMEPVAGAAVLAVLVPAGDVQDLMNGGMRDPADRNAAQITAERADGSVLSASLFDAMNRPHPAWGPECQPGMIIDEPVPVPTTPLPDPGPEQPADPAAARAEIEHNFSLLYGPRDPAIDRSLYIDDNFGFAEASAEVERNFPGAADGASVAIDELVFVDASTAMFRYTLDTPAADFHDQLGRARLLDGVWKITRSTLCQDMSHGGAMCPP